ncbi:hypothetical protein TcCL_ESM11465 [Trypanosoma cruzi]|nr:hypothetical protein TcCL_ESM11465 [Trypanosoma cruzi]
MAQKHIQCAAGARGQARQTVADGEVKRIRREGPIHITVTREHASTKCADSTGDHSKCDSDSVTDKQICLLPGQSTNAVPTVPQHGRSQRAGTWCLHSSRHHRPGLERAPSPFARTTSSMEKLRQRALLRYSRLRTSSAGGSLPPGEAVCAFHAAAATHSACSTLTVQVHPVAVTAAARNGTPCCSHSAYPTMWSQLPEALHTPRWKHSSRLHAGQRRHVSVVAACLPVAGCRPPLLQYTMADGGPSPCKGVDVQWETRSTRCAVTSGNETLRPLIRVACAGSSDSSHSMPLGVAARFSPAVVDVSDRHAAHGVNSGRPQ